MASQSDQSYEVQCGKYKVKFGKIDCRNKSIFFHDVQIRKDDQPMFYRTQWRATINDQPVNFGILQEGQMRASISRILTNLYSYPGEDGCISFCVGSFMKHDPKRLCNIKTSSQIYLNVIIYTDNEEITKDFHFSAKELFRANKPAKKALPLKKRKQSTITLPASKTRLPDLSLKNSSKLDGLLCQQMQCKNDLAIARKIVKWKRDQYTEITNHIQQIIKDNLLFEKK